MALLPLTAILIFLTINSLVFGLPEEIRFGGIFEDGDDEQELAFTTAIAMINDKRELLPKVKLVAQVERISKYSIISASQKACKLMTMGVAGIFGPRSKDLSRHVQSICKTMEVPYIATSWDSASAINMDLYPLSLTETQLDLIRHWGWTSYAILYEYITDLVELAHFLHQPNHWTHHTVTIRQLPVHGDNFRNVLRNIRAHKQTNIIINCQKRKIYSILKQAQQVGMMTDKYHYFITDVNLDFIDLTDFQYSGATIIGLRTVNVTKTQEAIQHTMIGQNKTDTVTFDYQSALLLDGVNLLARGLAEIQYFSDIDVFPSLSCETEVRPSSTNNGSYFTLLNVMKMVRFQGFSGSFSLNLMGQRRHFDLDIIQLHETGLQKIGTWSGPSPSALQITHSKPGDDMPDALEFRTLRVTTILSSPFVTKKEGIDQYKGFCIDLLDEMSKLLRFNYTISLVKDGYYGMINQQTGEWNGIIGELITNSADLAIGDVRITSARAQVVDFSTPYMHFGITAVMQRPKVKSEDLFAFLWPFSFRVWCYIAAAYLAASSILFILARFHEWKNLHSCIKDPEFHYNDFGILNSLWFTLGSLMLQGSNLVPKAISTRIAAATWWLFAIFMTAIYTAKMMAFVTIGEYHEPIRTEWDLITKNQIKYGCLDRGSTRAFFENSNIALYQQAYATMALSDPSGFIGSMSEGLERVRRGNFALFLESTKADFLVERDCDLNRIGFVLDNKGYGIMFPKNSPYKQLISSSILDLQRQNIIKKLQDKWWQHRRSYGHCDRKDREQVAVMSSRNLAGLFLILLGGLLLACIVAIGEFLCHIRQIHPSERGTIPQELLRRLKFAASNQTIKNVRKPVPEATNESEEEELPTVS